MHSLYFLADIHKRNDQFFTSGSICYLNVTDTSQHLKQARLFPRFQTMETDNDPYNPAKIFFFFFFFHPQDTFKNGFP